MTSHVTTFYVADFKIPVIHYAFTNINTFENTLSQHVPEKSRPIWKPLLQNKSFTLFCIFFWLAILPEGHSMPMIKHDLIK